MLQKTVQKMFEKPKQEFVVVNMEEGVKKAGLKDVLPVEVAPFLNISNYMYLHLSVCFLQVWPETAAVCELATKIKKQKRAMNCDDYKPFIAAELKKYVFMCCF